MLKPLSLTIRRGETVDLPIRVESDTLVYKAITAITSSGAARITATAHDCPDGWRAAVANAGGMREINFPDCADGKPPKDGDMHRAAVIDANTIEFNAINSAGFRAYTSGGQLVYYAPLDLAAYTGARMDIKDRVGGTVLLSLRSADGELELDAATDTLWLRLTDEATALLAFDSGVFDIELTDASGDVKAICSADSTFTVLPEVTTAA